MSTYSRHKLIKKPHTKGVKYESRGDGNDF